MIKRPFRNVFVTVGTTQFEELVNAVVSTAVLQQLERLGCEALTIQTGTGSTPELKCVQDRSKIRISCYDLKSNIGEDIKQADLVISHAGAGSCIEVLEACRPLVVVVNESLMNNHQTELAERLSRDDYLFFCTPSNLHHTLAEVDFSRLKKLASGSLDSFIEHLDKCMGFK
ncbi:UDP-N-acetylglucosamine transferase subunit ALG13 homolog [Anopheles bellator]|uniref:UDP-N-acetylglucosamine transferase subunit ALG13 homolog n=1 Tax=Anopheles bellator TaxID=139047 RepID=UPI002649073B|nr:UDP-N-acetylglucosamine transferase subunit ALG13 homolog [Anopheles bellator]